MHFVDHTLFRAFLKIPGADMIQNAGTEEMTRDPLIERLCSHLIESSGSEPEVTVSISFKHAQYKHYLPGIQVTYSNVLCSTVYRPL